MTCTYVYNGVCTLMSGLICPQSEPHRILAPIMYPKLQTPIKSHKEFGRLKVYLQHGRYVYIPIYLAGRTAGLVCKLYRFADRGVVVHRARLHIIPVIILYTLIIRRYGYYMVLYYIVFMGTVKTYTRAHTGRSQLNGEKYTGGVYASHNTM